MKDRCSARKDPAGEPVIHPTSPRPSTFCPIRCRLSKQFPALILGFNHPKCKVSQAKVLRNWALTLQINDPVGSYHVICEIRKAVQPGRQKQDLTIVVESDYHDDPEQADPVLLGEMGFLTLCANTYMRKPVTVKR